MHRQSNWKSNFYYEEYRMLIALRKRRLPSLARVVVVVFHTGKLSPGGLRQFTLSPVRDDDRTQELGLTLLGRVPMLALYPHTSLVYSYYYHNIYIYSLCLHTSFLHWHPKLVHFRSFPKTRRI